MAFQNLIQQTIRRLSFVLIKEPEDTQWLTLDDTFLLYLEDGRVWQLSNDSNEFSLQLVEGEKDIKVIGSLAPIAFDYKSWELPSPRPIAQIIHYRQPHTDYCFGGQFIDAEGNYILGFCYGFDEIQLLKTVEEWEALLALYEERVEEVVE